MIGPTTITSAANPNSTITAFPWYPDPINPIVNGTSPTKTTTAVHRVRQTRAATLYDVSAAQVARYQPNRPAAPSIATTGEKRRSSVGSIAVQVTRDQVAQAEGEDIPIARTAARCAEPVLPANADCRYSYFEEESGTTMIERCCFRRDLLVDKARFDLRKA